MRVGFLGPDGSFSSRAARALFVGADHAPQASVDDVMTAVIRGDVQAATVPLTNKLAGAVPGMLGKLAGSGRVIDRLVWLPVDLVLLGLHGAALDDIAEVRSHPVALRQAPALFDDGRRGAPWSSTANAAQSVLEVGDRSIAALGDRALAERLGLSVIAEPLAGVDNATLFAGVIAHAPDDRAALWIGPVSEAPPSTLVVDGELALWSGAATPGATPGATQVGTCAWPIPTEG